MKIISVVGARPNFMKIAPFISEVQKHDDIHHILVHTGQHYDVCMSLKFFKELNIPEVDINLDIGSGSHAEQVGETMIAFEKVLIKEQPDWVVVVGDVNATLACSVTSKKLHIKVCHIEAGLRSGDLEMPEEINRLVTDRLSDLLLAPDKIAIENLKKEGVPDNKIKFVGNIMIDTLEANRKKAEELDIKNIIVRNFIEGQSNIKISSRRSFCLITMHRPSNVDQRRILEPIIRFILDEVVVDLPVIWTIHPRTQTQLENFGLYEEILANEQLILLHPLGYHDMLKLNMESKIMFTDSGGLQEECTILGTPCLTLRWNTERPVTLMENGGASILAGNDISCIRDKYKKIKKINCEPKRPDYWDGNTAFRCLQAVLDYK